MNCSYVDYLSNLLCRSTFGYSQRISRSSQKSPPLYHSLQKIFSMKSTILTVIVDPSTPGTVRSRPRNWLTIRLINSSWRHPRGSYLGSWPCTFVSYIVRTNCLNTYEAWVSMTINLLIFKVMRDGSFEVENLPKQAVVMDLFVKMD